jgi:hypothetical protein
MPKFGCGSFGKRSLEMVMGDKQRSRGFAKMVSSFDLDGNESPDESITQSSGSLEVPLF